MRIGPAEAVEISSLHKSINDILLVLQYKPEKLWLYESCRVGGHCQSVLPSMHPCQLSSET